MGKEGEVSRRDEEVIVKVGENWDNDVWEIKWRIYVKKENG